MGVNGKRHAPAAL